MGNPVSKPKQEKSYEYFIKTPKENEETVRLTILIYIFAFIKLAIHNIIIYLASNQRQA